MKKRLKIGNVYAIPLPNKKYAFGRYMNDGGFAIYKGQYDKVEDFDKKAGYFRIIGVYRNLLTDGQWPFVCNLPFENDDESWPPPKITIDPLTGNVKIYERGAFRPVLDEEEYEKCFDYEPLAAWDRQHVEDMLMGDAKWDDGLWIMDGKDMRNKDEREEYIKAALLRSKKLFYDK